MIDLMGSKWTLLLARSVEALFPWSQFPLAPDGIPRSAVTARVLLLPLRESIEIRNSSSFNLDIENETFLFDGSIKGRLETGHVEKGRSSADDLSAAKLCHSSSSDLQSFRMRIL